MSKQTAPPKGWGEVSREELIKREFEMVKRIEKEELTFDGLTPIEFALRELYEFQEATGYDTAAEFKTNLEKDTEGYMQKVIDALYENGDPVSVEAAELFEHMAQQRLKPVAWMYEFYADMGHKGLAFEKQSSAFNKPLYFNPSQRTWIGLTDDELELLNDCGDTDSYQFARSIEAKLKEKNTRNGGCL